MKRIFQDTNTISYRKSFVLCLVGVALSCLLFSLRFLSLPGFVWLEEGSFLIFAAIFLGLMWMFFQIKRLNLATFSLEKISEMVFWVNQDGKFVYVNESVTKSLGYSKAELLQMSVFDIDMAFPAGYWKTHLDDLQKRRSYTIESLHRRKDGTIFPVELTITYVDFAGNNYHCTFAKDITERKKAEESLRKNERFLSNILESIQDGVCILDKDLTILRVNAVVEKWHPSSMPMVGKKCFACYCNETQPCPHCPALRCIKSGHTETQVIYTFPNTTAEWLEIYSYPMKNPQTGEVTGVLEFVRNITEKKKAELALQESEAKFRTLFENMEEGVALHELVFDKDHNVIDYRLLDINPAYEKHTGIPVSRAHGALGSELYGTAIAPYLETFAEVAKTGKSFTYDTYFLPLRRHFHVSVVSPSLDHFATVFEDITDRKNQEKELQDRNLELNRFTYTVSHDLRSPLITIKGFVGSMQEDLASERTDRIGGDLKRIADAANKMEALLRDLLELSRIGRIIHPPCAISMASLVKEVSDLLAGIIKQKKVEIVIISDLPTIYGDKVRMGQVIQNLLENAIKYMGNQSMPRIEIGCKIEDKEMLFLVRDNGIGIDPKYHETIFGLFNKLDAKSEGTGIGLSLVRRILDVHGGKVWVESAGIGAGSTFYFTLPASTPPSKKIRPTDEQRLSNL